MYMIVQIHECTNLADKVVVHSMWNAVRTSAGHGLVAKQSLGPGFLDKEVGSCDPHY